jgi:hypothetical protein
VELRKCVDQKVLKKLSDDRQNRLSSGKTLSFQAFDWPWAVEIVPNREASAGLIKIDRLADRDALKK